MAGTLFTTTTEVSENVTRSVEDSESVTIWGSLGSGIFMIFFVCFVVSFIKSCCKDLNICECIGDVVGCICKKITDCIRCIRRPCRHLGNISCDRPRAFFQSCISRIRDLCSSPNSIGNEVETQTQTTERNDISTNTEFTDLQTPQPSPSAPSEPELPPPSYSSVMRMNNGNNRSDGLYIVGPPPSYDEVVC